MNRHPAVAGVFYPENPQNLHQLLNQYLQDAQIDAKVPKAIIAPHAGYIYSGPIAASAYSRLAKGKDRIKRVVIVGPSHRSAFSGLAVSRADSFSTPLGDISVDRTAIELLLELPFVEYNEQAHVFEHSLEVQLPFLQESLTDFKIVPVVAGDASAGEVAQMLDLLWNGEETLIVISSDLSHYHDYHTAKKLDTLTSENIERLEYEQLSSSSACGRIPISGLLKLAREKSLSVKAVDLRSSGDTAGDKTRVVGYGAYVIE